MQISNRVNHLPVSATRKLSALGQIAKEQGVKIYHLNIGDPDIATTQPFIDALKNWSSNPIRYASSAGEPVFLSAMRNYYHQLGFSCVEKKNITVTIGASEAVSMVLFSITDPGDEILVFEPFYSNYQTYAAIGNISLIPVPTTINTGFPTKI